MKNLLIDGVWTRSFITIFIELEEEEPFCEIHRKALFEVKNLTKMSKPIEKYSKKRYN